MRLERGTGGDGGADDTKGQSMGLWQMYKKGFEAWESATAQWLELCLKSPLLLWPAGAIITRAMRSKTAMDRLLHRGWGSLGLATKRDQERALHALNELNSRLLDLEEQVGTKAN